MQLSSLYRSNPSGITVTNANIHNSNNNVNNINTILLSLSPPLVLIIWGNSAILCMICSNEYVTSLGTAISDTSMNTVQQGEYKIAKNRHKETRTTRKNTEKCFLSFKRISLS